MGTRVSETGFTIVEVIVTLTLAALFVAFFVQMFESIAAQQFSVSRQATAHNIASSNLSKFPSSSAIDDLLGSGAYSCSPSPSSENDLTSNPRAPGTVLIAPGSTHIEPDTQGLPNPVQEVRAYSPLGCSNGLIKIESTVSYGFTATQGEAVYATYIR